MVEDGTGPMVCDGPLVTDAAGTASLDAEAEVHAPHGCYQPWCTALLEQDLELNEQWNGGRVECSLSCCVEVGDDAESEEAVVEE